MYPPVLSIGEVACTLIDLQRALTGTLTLILLHSEQQTVKQQISEKLVFTV